MTTESVRALPPVAPPAAASPSAEQSELDRRAAEAAGPALRTLQQAHLSKYQGWTRVDRADETLVPDAPPSWDDPHTRTIVQETTKAARALLQEFPPPENAIVLTSKDFIEIGLLRSVIVHERKIYVLLTKSSKLGDGVVGQGFMKTAKYAMSEDGEILVISVVRREDIEPESLPGLVQELNYYQQFQNVPGIVDIRCHCRTPQKLYILSKYYPDGDLHTLHNRFEAEGHESIPLRRLLPIVRDVAMGLQHVHAQGIIHGDIKPDNFFVDGNRGVLADFGLARSIDDDRNRQLVGSLGYIPPEGLVNHSILAFTNEYDNGELLKELTTPQWDSWAFGISLYELITGSKFESDIEERLPFFLDPKSIQVRNYGDFRSVAMLDDWDGKIRRHIEERIPETHPLRDLVISLLKIDPLERATARNIFDVTNGLCVDLDL